jgi:hypothetical protein
VDEMICQELWGHCLHGQSKAAAGGMNRQKMMRKYPQAQELVKGFLQQI